MMKSQRVPNELAPFGASGTLPVLGAQRFGCDRRTGSVK